jgi:ribose transport system substrate-binding protein
MPSLDREPRVKVLVSLPDNCDEVETLQVQDAWATADRLGLELELVHADNNPVLQIQQILRAMRAPVPPNAIVVEPLATQALETVLRRAAEVGIGSAVLNDSVGYIEALRAEFPRVAVLRVSVDQMEVGRMQGRHVRALLPAGGTVLYIQGAQTASAAERLEGFQEAIGSASIRILALDGCGSRESAERAVGKWIRLRGPENARIDLVAAQSDSMALGARRALEVEGPRWSRISYLGIGGVPSGGQQLVDSGTLTATVVLPSATGPAIESLERGRRGGGVPATVALRVGSYPAESELLKPVKRPA